MKKFLLMASLVAGTSTMAQMTAGSICPDFTGTDLNGVTHNLYDYLDDGYTVVIEVSATWCGPCWNYHNTNSLKNLYTQYGPGTAEDKVMVLFIEGDGATTLADLQGTTGSTQGDWITGTPFPIIDNATIANTLQISYFPTIYTVCPNRRVAETSQLSTAAHWALVGKPCNTAGVNMALKSYDGPTGYCSDLDVDLTVSNMGLDPITSANIAVKEGSTTLASQAWSGTLYTWQEDGVSIPNVTPTNAPAVMLEITTTDAVASDNTLDPNLVNPAAASWAVTIEGKVDQYPNEFAWRMVDPNGVEVAQGGNYTLVNESTTNCDNGLPAAGPGTYGANAVFAVDVELTEMGCYKVEAFDSYGDGLTGSTTSYFRVRNSNGSIVIDVDYLCESSSAVVNDAVGVEEATAGFGLAIYPNPTNGVVNMEFKTSETKVNVDVYNVLGERIMTRTLSNNGVQTMDMAGLNNGLYYFNITAGENSITQKVTLNR